MSEALDAVIACSVRDGSRAFRVEASLRLPEGILVLFGPSGAGKTLTLRALAGLVRLTSGHVRVNGVTLVDAENGVELPAHERRVGYVPQAQALFPFLDVEANVAFGLPRGARSPERVAPWLAELGLAHLAHASPDSLSGGERQRVALARALAVTPRLLLLDEPFASLDAVGRAELVSVVRDVVSRRGIPAVVVTHDREEAASMADVVVQFAAGRSAPESGEPPG